MNTSLRSTLNSFSNLELILSINLKISSREQVCPNVFKSILIVLSKSSKNNDFTSLFFEKKTVKSFFNHHHYLTRFFEVGLKTSHT